MALLDDRVRGAGQGQWELGCRWADLGRRSRGQGGQCLCLSTAGIFKAAYPRLFLVPHRHRIEKMQETAVESHLLANGKAPGVLAGV